MEKRSEWLFQLSLAAQYPSHTFLRPGTNVAGSPLPCTWFPAIVGNACVLVYSFDKHNADRLLMVMKCMAVFDRMILKTERVLQANKNYLPKWCKISPRQTQVMVFFPWAVSSVSPDLNECSLSTDDCDVNADCVNTNGSFSCHCKKGYSGSGRTGNCQGKIRTTKRHASSWMFDFPKHRPQF